MRLLPRRLMHPRMIGSLLVLALVECVRNALLLSLLPSLGVDALKLSPAVIGLAISAHYLSDNLLRTPMGFLNDRFGQRIVLASGIIVAAAALVFLSRADSARELVAGAALFGVGTSPLWPCVVSTVTSGVRAAEKASAMGYLYIAWLIGGGAGPVLINFVYVLSYPMAFGWIVDALLAAGFITVVVSRRVVSRPHRPENWTAADAHRYLREIIVHLKGVSVLFPGMFVQTLAIGVLIPILTPYARLVLNVTPPWQSAAMVIVGGATVALLPVSGRLVDRFGARPFLSGGFLLAGMALVLFAAQTRYLPALMFMIALGSAYAMILPSWNSLLDRSVDAAKRGAMWGVFMTVEGLGTAVGPLIGGRLWQSVGPRAPFLFSAFLVCSMGVIYTFLRLPGLRRSLRTRTEWT